MNNPTTPEPNKPLNPTSPGEGQQTRPNSPEINPAKPGNDTEVDLDKSKIKTYPDKTPERH